MDMLALLNDKALPFAELLGIRFVSAELDRVVAEMLRAAANLRNDA